jgi:hypothetical protein
MEQTLSKQEKRKIYREKSKEKIKEARKIYHEDNKDKLADDQIEYKLKNKDNEEQYPTVG